MCTFCNRPCFYLLLYRRRGNSEWFNHIPSPSKTHIQGTSDWQGSSHSNRNLGLSFILLEFMSSTVVSWVNGGRNVEWHWITDSIMVLFWWSGGDSLLLWGWSEERICTTRIFFGNFLTNTSTFYNKIFEIYRYF